MRLVRPVATAALLMGVLASAPSLAAPARAVSLAVPVPVPVAGAGCGGSALPVLARVVGRSADGTAYSQRRLRWLQRDLTRRLRALGARHPELAAQAPSARIGPVLRIPVHVHMIDGAHVRGPSRHRVERQLGVLNRAYDGGQSSLNTPTHFTFYLASFQRVRRSAWRTAGISSAAERTMRQHLHVGGRQDLNLYIAKPTSGDGSVLLGFSTEPWQYAAHPRLDGVTIHQDSLPGGSLAGFNLGDTAVHEIGHWLGLLHPFTGRCSEPNDMVADTPEEATPSTTCDETKDSCTAPGLDPVRNFMDYAPDACMNRFTPDQVTRMTDEWLAYRTP
ncbi:MAG: zinc metalloprotease [Nocardioidaceae bacterium]